MIIRLQASFKTIGKLSLTDHPIASSNSFPVGVYFGWKPLQLENCLHRPSKLRLQHSSHESHPCAPAEDSKATNMMVYGSLWVYTYLLLLADPPGIQEYVILPCEPSLLQGVCQLGTHSHFCAT